MLVERTPSYTLASGLLGHAGNTIGFVGYCDPDTPGGKLLAAKPGDTFLFETAHVKTKIKARVERFELERPCRPRGAPAVRRADRRAQHRPDPRRSAGPRLVRPASWRPRFRRRRCLDPVPLQQYLV